MKAIQKLSMMVILFAFFIGLLAGCNNDSDTTISMVIIIGRHANQNEFTDKYFDTVEPLIRRAVYGGEISVVVADGVPRYVQIVTSDGTLATFSKDANNNIIKNRRVDEYTGIVMEFLKSDATKAKNAEVDLLGAIREAARVLHDADSMEKHIVIMDTGVSTTGRIDLTHFSLNEIDIIEFADTLREVDGILPDLSDINIRFIGLGDVAHPQSIPDTTYPKLLALWQEILFACGVSEDRMLFPVSAFGTSPNEYSEDEDGFPFVSVVNFEPIIIVVKEESYDSEAPSENEEAGELLLPDVGFHPDSASLINEEVAIETLRPYADAIKIHFSKNTDSRLFLLGTTARTTPGSSGNITLSQKRAEKLMEILVSHGVPSDRLVAIGVGAMVPEHLRVDEFETGKFDSTLAQANRKATVYEVNNNDFLEILRFNNINVIDLKVFTVMN